jgi:polysaccharide biosynthesis/export protein
MFVVLEGGLPATATIELGTINKLKGGMFPMYLQYSYPVPQRARFAALCAMVLCGLALGGCAQQVRMVRETPLNDFIQRSNQVDAGGYTAQIGDVLTVKFYFNPELDYNVPVRPDGKISLSLIGDVAAAGNTMQSLSTTITAAYKAHLNQPNATVILQAPAGHRVFVTGEVSLPGVFTLQGTETALSAISLAGGLNDRATFHKIFVVRRLPDGSAPMVAMLDLRKALNGSDPRQDVKLLMNDVVFVPRTGAAEADVRLKNIIWNKAPFLGTANATWNGTLK